MPEYPEDIFRAADVPERPPRLTNATAPRPPRAATPVTRPGMVSGGSSGRDPEKEATQLRDVSQPFHHPAEN